MSYEFIYERFKSRQQNFGNNFVDNIAKQIGLKRDTSSGILTFQMKIRNVWLKDLRRDPK